MGRLTCKKVRQDCLVKALHPPNERCNEQSLSKPSQFHQFLYGKTGSSTIMNPYVANDTITRQGDLGSGSTEIYSKKRRARGAPTADFHQKMQRAQIYDKILAKASREGDNDGRNRFESQRTVDPRNPGVSFIPYQQALSWQQAARRGTMG